MSKIQACLILTLLFLLPLQVQASEGQTTSVVSGKLQVADMFLEKKMIDGYQVSFHIMRVDPGQEHGGSHNVMIKVEENGTVLGNVVLNSKVVTPNGASSQKRLMKMGDWYMNGYDMGEPGTYKVMILFKTADGKKHKGVVRYPG